MADIVSLGQDVYVNLDFVRHIAPLSQHHKTARPDLALVVVYQDDKEIFLSRGQAETLAAIINERTTSPFAA